MINDNIDINNITETVATGILAGVEMDCNVREHRGNIKELYELLKKS